jgi:hypothetical protein
VRTKRRGRPCSSVTVFLSTGPLGGEFGCFVEEADEAPLLSGAWLCCESGVGEGTAFLVSKSCSRESFAPSPSRLNMPLILEVMVGFLTGGGRLATSGAEVPDIRVDVIEPFRCACMDLTAPFGTSCAVCDRTGGCFGRNGRSVSDDDLTGSSDADMPCCSGIGRVVVSLLRARLPIDY